MTTKVNSELVVYTPAGVGAVATDVETKLREFVSVKDFGASPSNTNAANKTALQTAITAVNALGGGQIVVPSDINYGFVRSTLSTHPSFSGVTSPVMISDYSPGNSYAGFPTAYDGAQYRLWQHTPQTTSAGQHDGNGVWHRADWHPYYMISNDSDLAPVGDPSRTADDNRRASLFFANDGAVTWRVGQGNATGAGLTDDELSNFVVSAFGNYGGAAIDGTSALLIDRATGNFGFNTNPAASYHFKSKSTGFSQGLFESLTTENIVILRNSNGSADDVRLRNNAGNFELAVNGSNDLIVTKANRHYGFGSAPSFKMDVTESRASQFINRFRNNNTTNGFVQRLDSASAAGTGWSFIEAFSSIAGTPDLEFKLRGDGNGTCNGSWIGGGADYAEYFEWSDGNPDDEDRRGYSVSLVGNKIKKAEAGENIVGVISGDPSVVGDAAALKWVDKYLRDEFGSYLWEDDPDNEAGGKRRVLNPAYDPAAEYVPREARKEWDCVGLMGKLRVRKGQPVGDRWIKMRDITESVEEWLVR